jgi:hypothetical protein
MANSMYLHPKPLSISDNIDKAIGFIEKKILNTPVMKFIGKVVQPLAGSARQLRLAATLIDDTFHPAKDGYVRTFINQPKVTIPLNATRFLSGINILGNTTKFVKSIKTGIEAKKGIKKLDASMDAAKAATSLVGNTENIISGVTALNTAVKVSQVAGHVFGGFNIAGSALGLAITGRSIYRTHKCENRLNKIRTTNYKELNKFLTDDKNLKILGIEKSAKFKEIANKLVDNTKVLNANEQKKVDSLVKDLKGRLKTKQANHAIGVIGDCFNIVSTSLLIASVACPPLAIVSLTFALGTTLGTFIHRQVTDYQFERKVGLIEKCPEHVKGIDRTLWKVKDFAKWNLKSFIS